MPALRNARGSVWECFPDWQKMLRAWQERSSVWQSSFKHVIKMSVGVTNIVYTRVNRVCQCVKVSCFVCKERLAADKGNLRRWQECMSGWQMAFTHVTVMYDGVAETVYTCDRNVCRGDRKCLHMCKACLSPDRDDVHTHRACLPMWQTFRLVRGGGLTIDKGFLSAVWWFPTRGRGSEMEWLCKFSLQNVL